MAGTATERASLAADCPRQSVGSPGAPRQSVGSPDALRQSVGSPNALRQSAGSSDALRQTVGSDASRQTVGSSDASRQTVGSSDTSRQAAGSLDALRQTVGSPDTPRQTVGPSDAPRRTLSLSFPWELAAAAAPAGSALLVEVAAGWHAAGEQPASRAVRLVSPHSARGRIQDWAEPATCVLLEREENAGPDRQRPGLTLSVAPGHPLAIAEVGLLSEFGRCELFGDHGEYLATEEACLEETVDDTLVLSLRHRCQPPVNQLTLQCVSPSGRGQLWVYGVEVVLQPAAVRPAPAAFSLPAVLARLDAQQAALPAGAATLRAALTAASRGGPPTVAPLTATAGRPAEKASGAAEKECGGETLASGERGTALPAGLEPALARCAAGIEERLWRRIAPRLESIEQKQDEILARLDRLSMRCTDGNESPE